MLSCTQGQGPSSEYLRRGEKWTTRRRSRKSSAKRKNVRPEVRKNPTRKEENKKPRRTGTYWRSAICFLRIPEFCYYFFVFFPYSQLRPSQKLTTPLGGESRTWNCERNKWTKSVVEETEKATKQTRTWNGKREEDVEPGRMHGRLVISPTQRSH